ncbi:DNA-binding CsgD family transcriptional regulator [Kibdelosporangium banguiense]|uniref:DNA-binding CsgD family transcriptional regulator n=1 Tax=Kibdelosporangium banguiense TaxID=1365924 RepID=A0ABS4TRS8_9PSEU|nr:LuxR family transcriptional regulator [Kibdelosporangium banguiense]MBP2327122.1 DNA-binding CsgD family transcriptional regulator [Kibdelosporangium banguiense]
MGVTWGKIHHIDSRQTLDLLRDKVTECSSGTGSVVLITGGTASGKTHVHNEFVDYAATSGILTLSATGAADERLVDGGVIDQLLANAALPAELSDRFGDIPGGTAEEQIGEVCRALHRLARERAVLIAVDDLQYVDNSSLQLLLQLQRRTRSAGLLMVLNQSDPRRGNAFTTQPHHHVELTAMTVTAIAELIDESEAPDQLAAEIHRLSAGNPLLASALIDDYRQDGDIACAGAGYSQAVRTLLHRWGSPVNEVATALAVLDTDTDTEAVATVCGVGLHDTETAMGVLTGFGLVTDGRFRHPSVTAAILDALPGEAKSELHLRAAEVKHQQAVAAPQVAAHLLAAGEAGAEWSATVLTEAAEHAMLTDDVDFATRCLNLAASLAVDDAEREAITRLLAKITWRVNPSGASSYLASLRQPNHDDLTLQVRQSLWYGERETFGGAFETLTNSEDSVESRTVAELTLASLWHYGSAPSLDSSAPATPNADPWQHTARTLATVWHSGGNDNTSACAERILQNCRLSDTTLEALATAILALAYDNKIDRAEGWCASLSEEAAQRGAVAWRAMLDAVWAGIILRRGDADAAVAMARGALAMLSPANWGVAICYPLTTLLMAHTATGAVKAAVEILRHPVPPAALNTVGGLRYLRARGHFYLATNRVLAAVSDFQDCRRRMCDWDVDMPTLIPWRTDLAEANLHLGNPSVAVELAKQQLAMAAKTDSYTHATVWRILASVGKPAERTGLLGRAAACFKAAGDHLELGRTLEAMGQLRHGAGQAKPVRPSRRAAVPTPRPMPAPTGARAPEAPPSTETPESTMLSDAQLRVAQLAALGHTNRQIANTLYITVSTVEQHLTRVYRKLGVPGRSALPEDPALVHAAASMTEHGPDL